MPTIEQTAHDTSNWAEPVATLPAVSTPAEAINLNVAGKPVTFGTTPLFVRASMCPSILYESYCLDEL